jgi:hypothetical protein
MELSKKKNQELRRSIRILTPQELYCAGPAFALAQLAHQPLDLSNKIKIKNPPGTYGEKMPIEFGPPQTWHLA